MPEEYPATFEEFLEQFATEADCAEYIRGIRWPNGFVCPRCGGCKAWLTKKLHMRCASCKRDASVIAGTVFADTRKSLRLWFQVMWFMMAQRNGVSAKNLRESLGPGRYQTIWGWLHKLRSVMVRLSRERLSEAAEVDGTYIGGEAKGKRGRGADKTALVSAAVEGVNDKLGRVRSRCVLTPRPPALYSSCAGTSDPAAK